MPLDRTTVRMFKGIALVPAIAAVLVFLYAVLHPSEADIERAAEELRLERRQPQQRDPNYAWPEITRLNFVTKLPIPGDVNQYHWRAQGDLAYSVDRDRDCIVNFRLVTLGADKPIELVSPLALFDRKTRTLEAEVATEVTFSWGTVRSDTMRLDLDTTNAFFSENVVVEVTNTAESGLTGGGTDTTDTEDDTENDTKPAEKQPLRITADHFEIRSAEDTGTFIDNVKAVDGSGTIWADKMTVEYYSDEEKAADPSRTGMKRVTCTGDVRIDQKTEQAKCEKAVYDVAANVITLMSTETTRVLYRKDDGEDKHQVLADTVIVDRNPGGKTRFVGNVEAQDFSETRESFFGETEKDENNDGSGTTGRE